MMKARTNGTVSFLNKKKDYYEDGSLFTATLKRERIKAHMEHLKKKEK